MLQYAGLFFFNSHDRKPFLRFPYKDYFSEAGWGGGGNVCVDLFGK